jgi:hypothetical protein
MDDAARELWGLATAPGSASVRPANGTPSLANIRSSHSSTNFIRSLRAHTMVLSHTTELIHGVVNVWRRVSGSALAREDGVSPSHVMPLGAQCFHLLRSHSPAYLPVAVCLPLQVATADPPEHPLWCLSAQQTMSVRGLPHQPALLVR